MTNFVDTIAALFSSCFSGNRSSKIPKSESRGQESEDMAESVLGRESTQRHSKLRGITTKPKWLQLPSSRVARNAENISFGSDPNISREADMDSNDEKGESSTSQVVKPQSHCSVHESDDHVPDLANDVKVDDCPSAPLQYQELEETTQEPFETENNELRTSIERLNGKQMLQNVVDRMKSAEHRANRLECLLVGQKELSLALEEKNKHAQILEKKLALFECSSDKHTKLNEMVSGLCNAQARVRVLKSANEDLERQLNVMKTTSTQEIISLSARLQQKSQLLRDTTLRIGDVEESLYGKLSELAEMKKTLKQI